MIIIPIAMIVFGYALMYAFLAKLVGNGDELTGFLGLGLPGTTR